MVARKEEIIKEIKGEHKEESLKSVRNPATGKLEIVPVNRQIPLDQAREIAKLISWE